MHHRSGIKSNDRREYNMHAAIEYNSFSTISFSSVSFPSINNITESSNNTLAANIATRRRRVSVDAEKLWVEKAESSLQNYNRYDLAYYKAEEPETISTPQKMDKKKSSFCRNSSFFKELSSRSKKSISSLSYESISFISRFDPFEKNERGSNTSIASKFNIFYKSTLSLMHHDLDEGSPSTREKNSVLLASKRLSSIPSRNYDTAGRKKIPDHSLQNVDVKETRRRAPVDIISSRRKSTKKKDLSGSGRKGKIICDQALPIACDVISRRKRSSIGSLSFIVECYDRLSFISNLSDQSYDDLDDALDNLDDFPQKIEASTLQRKTRSTGKTKPKRSMLRHHKRKEQSLPPKSRKNKISPPYSHQQRKRVHKNRNKKLSSFQKVDEQTKEQSIPSRKHQVSKRQGKRKYRSVKETTTANATKTGDVGVAVGKVEQKSSLLSLPPSDKNQIIQNTRITKSNSLKSNNTESNSTGNDNCTIQSLTTRPISPSEIHCKKIISDLINKWKLANI